jgi:hypothetical protein
VMQHRLRTSLAFEERRGWDSSPRDGLTPPTRFPIPEGHLTSLVHGVLTYPIASISSDFLRPLSRYSHTLASIACARVLARLQYGCSKTIRAASDT